MSEPTLPLCDKCKQPLTSVTEEYSGTQHWDWNPETNCYTSEPNTEDPVKLFCGCGEPLTKAQAEWFDNHKH